MKTIEAIHKLAKRLTTTEADALILEEELLTKLIRHPHLPVAEKNYAFVALDAINRRQDEIFGRPKRRA